jgi:SAM-dependent methyltransferase
MLSAYHRAHAVELQSVIATLPLTSGALVLDLACGDGAHAGWLADRLEEGGVIGVDLSRDYLHLAREQAVVDGKGKGTPAPVVFCAGAAESLPFADGRFDLGWCAHSLYTLRDPLAALRELRRVVRPGGHVAVLEQDSLHRVVLPWPADLELALQQAQLAGLRRRPNGPGKYFVGRRLPAFLEKAGLEVTAVESFSTVRRAPLSADEHCYLEGLLDDLRQKAAPHLTPAMRDEFERLAEPESPQALLRRRDFHVTYLDHLAIGRR